MTTNLQGIEISRKKAIPTEGDIIHIYGYQFEACDVRIVSMARKFVNFRGVCTDSAANDTIRRTDCNGATYGWAL